MKKDLKKGSIEENLEHQHLDPDLKIPMIPFQLREKLDIHRIMKTHSHRGNIKLGNRNLVERKSIKVWRARQCMS